MTGMKKHVVALGVGWAIAYILKVIIVVAVTGSTIFPIAHMIPMFDAAMVSQDSHISGIEALHLSTWAFAVGTVPAMYWVLNQLGQQRGWQE